jgi:hypothetical protein
MEVTGATTTPGYRVSAKLVAAVRLHPLRGYVIAHRCGLHPSTLSKLVNGIDWVALGDERVLRLATFVGIPAAEAFDPARVGEKQESWTPASRRGDPHSLEDDDGP